MCKDSPQGGQCKLALPVFLLSIVISNACVLAAVAGPYVITVRELRTCRKSEVDADDDLQIEGILTSNRSSKDHLVFNGYAEVKNDCMTRGVSTVTLDFAKWDTVSGWREHFLLMPMGDICFLLEEVGADLGEVLWKYVGFPRKCPIPNRTFNCSNVPARIGQLKHFPILPYGRFRVYGRGYYTKRPEVTKPRGCIKLIVDVSQRFIKPTF